MHPTSSTANTALLCKFKFNPNQLNESFQEEPTEPTIGTTITTDLFTADPTAAHVDEGTSYLPWGTPGFDTRRSLIEPTPQFPWGLLLREFHVMWNKVTVCAPRNWVDSQSREVRRYCSWILLILMLGSRSQDCVKFSQYSSGNKLQMTVSWCFWYESNLFNSLFQFYKPYSLNFAYWKVVVLFEFDVIDHWEANWNT